MKHKCLLLLCLHTAAILCAQTDTSKVFEIRTEQGVLEPQRIVGQYDEVFGIHEPARWLFKWDAAAATGIGSQDDGLPFGGLRFDAEWKPGVAFSLNASYQLGIDELLSDPDFTHGFRLEPRWYLGMRKRVSEGKGASNFSGNYLGLEVMHFSRAATAESTLPRLIYRGAALRFGLQRRLFRRGYFDISYGVGVRDYPRTPYRRDLTDIFSEARVGLGLALARPKPVSAVSTSGYCEVLQCFREEQRMFKVDLFNLFRVATVDNLAGNARIALEQKIGASPFSIELEGQWNGRYGKYQFVGSPEYKQRRYGFGAQFQTRYYYTQKRRIATGKSGNNLSGVYMAWQADWAWAHTKTYGQTNPGGPDSETSRRSHIRSGLLWGIQHRMFRQGFIDFNIGAGWQQNYGGFPVPNDRAEFSFLGGLRVGWAF